ncbi:MAG: DUF3014 domain-containing protein [Porticoccaceae bacterium]
MTTKKSGSSKFTIAIGSFVAVALILGLLYKTGSLSKQSELELLGVIPEQTIIKSAVSDITPPSANIPQQTENVAAPIEPVQTAESTVENQTQSATKPEASMLPALNSSDEFVRETLLSTQSSKVTEWLKSDDLIRRSASFMDGLARGNLSEKVFPLGVAEGKFTTHRQDGKIWLNAGNYERYNTVVDILLSIDMKKMANFFHKVRPLLESAFSELGYRPRQMDGIILQTIDNILAAPIIVEPLALSRDSVVYKFADQKLEELMPLQKQLLRAGPENTRRIQQQAKALREALLNP